MGAALFLSENLSAGRRGAPFLVGLCRRPYHRQGQGLGRISRLTRWMICGTVIFASVRYRDPKDQSAIPFPFLSTVHPAACVAGRQAWRLTWPHVEDGDGPARSFGIYRPACSCWDFGSATRLSSCRCARAKSHSSRHSAILQASFWALLLWEWSVFGEFIPMPSLINRRRHCDWSGLVHACIANGSTKHGQARKPIPHALSP